MVVNSRVSRFSPRLAFRMPQTTHEALFCKYHLPVPCSAPPDTPPNKHFRSEIMPKGGKGGSYGGGGGGPEGQSKKMCQVFLRNLPLAMLEPVSGGRWLWWWWWLVVGGDVWVVVFGAQTSAGLKQEPLPVFWLRCARLVSYSLSCRGGRCNGGCGIEHFFQLVCSTTLSLCVNFSLSAGTRGGGRQIATTNRAVVGRTLGAAG